MCLAFLKKLLEKKPDIIAEKVELNNLIEFLKNRNSTDIADIEKEVNRYKELIMKNLSDAREIIDKMRHLKSNDPFSRASVEVKNSFCDKAILIIARGPKIEMGASDFISASKKAINELNGITPRQAAHMKFFFSESLDEIAKKMKLLMGNIEEFSEYMSTNVIADIENVQKEITAIRENEKKALYFDKNMDEIEKEVKELQAKEHKQSARTVESDQNRLNRLKGEMSVLNKEKTTIENEIDVEFSSLDKIMKRYSHDKADKGTKSLIEKYVESPSSSFLMYDKENRIKKVLENIKNSIERKEFEAEEKKYVHLCSILSNMDHFRQLRREYQSAMKRICDKESEIVKEERNYEKARRFNDEISETRSRIVELNHMKGQLEESKAKIRELNEKKIRDIEFLISSSTGIEVRIVY